MTQTQSKKFFSQNPKKYSLSDSCIGAFFLGFKHIFKVYRRDNSKTAENYLTGLLKLEKGHANMERIEEEVDKIN